jgi:hypothetical protein
MKTYTFASFDRSEGILLDKDSIRYIAAKRGRAKLCLNSVWGKLRKKQQMQTKLISEPQVLYRFLETPGIEVHNISLTMMWSISWQYSTGERVPSLRHTNEFIEAYVTESARLNLYRYLDRLKDKAIYTDTDSVIYKHPRNESMLIEMEDNLGQMTSELKPDEIICEVVCAGPKNYAYKTLNTSTGAVKTVQSAWNYA